MTSSPGPSPSRPDRGGAEGAPAAPTILVVDDERNIRRTLDLVLRGEGYAVLEAPSAEDALRILESPDHPVDLAVIDIMLPGMSGIDSALPPPPGRRHARAAGDRHQRPRHGAGRGAGLEARGR
ncbi:MAG: response regulator [Minicystis sp.]